MQADGRIGVYMVGGRDGCTPMPVPETFANDMFDVFFEAEYLHDGQIRTHGHTGAATLQTAQGHWCHAGSLRHLLGGQLPTQPGQTEPAAKLA